MDIKAVRAWLTARYDEDEASDWPHRRSCQMLQPVPEGFPWPTFSCNCDAAGRWLHALEAKRAILAALPADPDGYDGDRVTFGGWLSCTDSCVLDIMRHVLVALAQEFITHPHFPEDLRLP